MSPQHIHDRFFREAFSRPDVVADFIQAYLPTDFSSQFSMETLVRLQDSHVDESLGQYYVDLLYSVTFGSQAITIALLLEHKSYPEEYPHFQLNQYLLNYWRDQLKEKQALRPVVPIVIYHGSSVWKQRPMTAYFTTFDAQLTRFLPDFEYYLINLTGDPDNKFGLLTSAYARLTAGLLKTIRQKQQLKKMLADLSSVIDKLTGDASGEQFVKTALLYVGYGSGLTNVEVFVVFKNISSKTERIAMSAFEQLEAEYIEKGAQ